MGSDAPQSGELQDGLVWFERSGRTLILGITQSGLSELGEIESVELPNEQDMEADEIMATIEGAEGKIELTAPAACTVIKVNSATKSEPSIVSDDPLEEGWLVKIEIQDLEDFTA